MKIHAHGKAIQTLTIQLIRLRLLYQRVVSHLVQNLQDLLQQTQAVMHRIHSLLVQRQILVARLHVQSLQDQLQRIRAAMHLTRSHLAQQQTLVVHLHAQSLQNQLQRAKAVMHHVLFHLAQQ